MFFIDGSQIDQLAGTLQASGAAVVKEVEIRCWDGYQLSADVVANFAIEAKHNLSGAYTNIETTPIDLSSWAGTDQTFQLRFTPTATTGVFNFALRNGPA